jgi:hypothetical protein
MSEQTNKVFVKVYPLFSYIFPNTVHTLRLTLSACDATRARLHLAVHLLRANVPPRRCLHLLDLLCLLQPNVFKQVVPPCAVQQPRSRRNRSAVCCLRSYRH